MEWWIGQRSGAFDRTGPMLFLKSAKFGHGSLGTEHKRKLSGIIINLMAGKAKKLTKAGIRT